jgi:Flp pilus assembly protein TadD
MRFGCLALSIGLLLGARSFAASPDDIYLDAYRLIHEADQHTAANQVELARQRYLEAQENLKKLQASYPNYSKNAVEFRLDYIGEKVKNLPTPKAQAGQAPSQPAPSAPRDRTIISSPAEQINALNERIAQLQGDNAGLLAKLQEALAPKPAAVDPAEFTKARERIEQLEKEKELLRAALAQSTAKQPQAADLAMFEQAKAELDSTKKKVLENVATIAALSQENQRLQQDLAASRKNDVAAELQAKIAQLENERGAQQKARADLESKLAAAVKTPGENPRIKELEKERDTLQKKLNDATRELNESKSRGQAVSTQSLTNQLANLRARLEVYEARKVPFTKEELALMDKNVPKLAATAEPKTPKATPRELPPGAGVLVAQAQAAFAGRRYAEAEEKYKQVLKMDEKNPVTLANVAAIQLELQKFDEAEANLAQATVIAPDDAYALSLMGMLRFQQGKYDEALGFLSRSAQLDPRNSETQNYLGITLSQQGQREAAETALRKAVVLNPNYAGAHHNLAVIYATQRPPFVELAKYHYNKALALGQSANAELEKQFGLGGQK